MALSFLFFILWFPESMFLFLLMMAVVFQKSVSWPHLHLKFAITHFLTKNEKFVIGLIFDTYGLN